MYKKKVKLVTLVAFRCFVVVLLLLFISHYLSIKLFAFLLGKFHSFLFFCSPS